MSCDAVIIGGGVGGLGCAALLAARGKRVLLCEASDRLGGFQHRFEVDGFHFEPNFHFLQDAGPGRPVRQLLAALGIEHEFRLLDPVARLYFPDRVVDIPNDRAAFVDCLKRDFPHEADNIDALFAESHALYLALTRQQPSPTSQAPGRPKPDLTPLGGGSGEAAGPGVQLIPKYAGDTMHAFVSRFVRDQKLRAIVGAWAAYFGYGSDRITALGIVVFTEACWDGGIHHPADGIGAIVDKLRTAIETHGGEVRLNAPVRNILIRDGRACGVRLADGTTQEARTVVSSADTLSTLRDMVDDKSLAQAASAPFATLDRFRSPFAVYLGVRSEGLDLRDGAAVRIAFANEDLAAQDRAQIADDIEHASLSMGIPTRLNPELAPAGHDIVILYTFLANDAIDALLNDRASSDALARRMVKRAEQAIPGLGGNIVVMETSATKTRVLYNANSKGALGWSPDPATLPRMPDHRSAIPGLALCGQWTRTGGGMNNVFASAQLAIEASAN